MVGERILKGFVCQALQRGNRRRIPGRPLQEGLFAG